MGLWVFYGFRVKSTSVVWEQPILGTMFLDLKALCPTNIRHVMLKYPD